MTLNSPFFNDLSFSETYHYYEPYTYDSNYTDYNDEQEYQSVEQGGWDLVPGNGYIDYKELGGDGNASQDSGWNLVAGNDYGDYMGGVRFIPVKQAVICYEPLCTKITKFCPSSTLVEFFCDK